MKPRYAKPAKIIQKLLPAAGFTLLVWSILVSYTAGIAQAAVTHKLDYNDFDNMAIAQAQKECSQQKFIRPVFKDDCIKQFESYATQTYFASSQKQINNLKQYGCTNNLLWTDVPPAYGSCTAAIDGITYAQSIMDNPAAVKTTKKPDASKTPTTQSVPKPVKAPPITDCNKLSDPSAQKKCRQDYRNCDQVPYSPSKIANCKKQTIQDAQNADQKKQNGNGKGGNGNGNGQPKGVGQGSHCVDYNHCDLVALYVNPFIRLLTIVVGLAVAASLIMGGIQYIASSGDPQKVGAAKTRITNTLMAFFAYAFMYAFLNFLVPGGLF